MGIQRCGILLIRLLFQVTLHLSRAYCSTGRRGVWGGNIKPLCPHILLSLGLNDVRPNAQQNKHGRHARDTNSSRARDKLAARESTQRWRNLAKTAKSAKSNPPSKRVKGFTKDACKFTTACGWWAKIFSLSCRTQLCKSIITIYRWAHKHSRDITSCQSASPQQRRWGGHWGDKLVG